jgi:hypothetical protein
MERKVILIDLTSLLVSLKKVFPGKAQCCLIRHEVTARTSSPFRCFVFKEVNAENPASQRQVDGNGSSTLMAISLTATYSGRIFIQKADRLVSFFEGSF